MKGSKKETRYGLVIFGSRTLSGPRIAKIIMQEIAKIRPDVIITAGDAVGVCDEARKIATQIPLPLECHYLDRSRNAGKYHHRSASAYRWATHAIFIHDGTSKGTQNEMNMADKMNIPSTYHLIT